MTEFEQAISKFEHQFRDQFIQTEKHRREQIRQGYLTVYNQLQESWSAYQTTFKDIPTKLQKFRGQQHNDSKDWWRGGKLFEFDALFPISEPLSEEISHHLW